MSVVIPTFNEADNIPYVFSRMPDDVHEVLIVDGLSSDGTAEVAREASSGCAGRDPSGSGEGRGVADRVP